jgi:predicted DNA-binding protein
MSKHAVAVKTSAKTRATRKAVAPAQEVPAASRAKTLRLTPEYEAGLDLLKGVLGKAVNKMVNEAVGEYIKKHTETVRMDLETLLARVQTYRLKDPEFNHAAQRLVESEVRLTGKDPVEGVRVEHGRAVTKRRRSQA